MPEDRQRQLCLVNVCPPVICEGSRRSVAKPDEGGTGTGSGIEVGEEKEGKQGLQLRLCGTRYEPGQLMASRCVAGASGALGVRWLKVSVVGAGSVAGSGCGNECGCGCGTVAMAGPRCM